MPQLKITSLTFMLFVFNVFHPEVLQHINTHVSVNNTTLYSIYNKISILSGRHVSTFIRSCSCHLRKQIQELSTFQCIVGSQIFNRSKNYLYFDALRDPKCLQHLESHNALKYRSLLDLFSQMAWGWPNKCRNMSPWQYTNFIVYRIK